MSAFENHTIHALIEISQKPMQIGGIRIFLYRLHEKIFAFGKVTSASK
jgi:hypothetical protein